jgi:hypothetical protein
MLNVRASTTPAGIEHAVQLGVAHGGLRWHSGAARHDGGGCRVIEFVVTGEDREAGHRLTIARCFRRSAGRPYERERRGEHGLEAKKRTRVVRRVLRAETVLVRGQRIAGQIHGARAQIVPAPVAQSSGAIP